MLLTTSMMEPSWASPSARSVSSAVLTYWVHAVVGTGDVVGSGVGTDVVGASVMFVIVGVGEGSPGSHGQRVQTQPYTASRSLPS